MRYRTPSLANRSPQNTNVQVEIWIHCSIETVRRKCPPSTNTYCVTWSTVHRTSDHRYSQPQSETWPLIFETRSSSLPTPACFLVGLPRNSSHFFFSTLSQTFLLKHPEKVSQECSLFLTIGNRQWLKITMGKVTAFLEG